MRGQQAPHAARVAVQLGEGPSRGEPIAASRLVTTAVVESMITGRPSAMLTWWRRNSVPPGRISRRSRTF
ncbi:hypothetical protein [Kocuria sp. CNJ-770]|uniref:hypothetical protein n=1 Tax=Kocuria sp. CNJ-770 TaxID=1904964 RepID=UPI002100E26F|nr:hypothetical protein [Kocuria sp. CNJ-770]